MTTAISVPEKSKTTVQVHVTVDVDAALLRGEIVEPKAIVEVDLLNLSVPARKALLAGNKQDGAFELKDVRYHRPHDKIDQPTADKIVAILELTGANLELSEAKAEQARLKMNHETAARLERAQKALADFLASSPNRGPVLITKALYVSHSAPCQAGDGYEAEGWLTTGYDAPTEGLFREEKAAHVKKFDGENAVLAQSLKADIAAHYATLDAKLAEKARVQAEKNAAEHEAEKKLRLKSGFYEETFEAYNHRRYGRPWGATIRLSLDQVSIEFCFVRNAFDGDDGDKGTVTVPCKPGDVIAVGQKDVRAGNSTVNSLLRMEEDGEMTTLTKAEAKRHLVGLAEWTGKTETLSE